jgi:uncharacterized phage-associated protein
MSASTSSAAIANAFLDIQDADKSSFPRIDAMKMQKLLFYAHAWWLAAADEPLFDEEIYAWPWGPVVPNVYGEFREFGRRPIVGKRATELVRIGDGPLSFRVREPEKPRPDVLKFLESLWSSHRGFTGIQLSNATHAEGEPWTIVKDQYVDLDSKPLIPNELIKEVFKNKMRA